MSHGKSQFATWYCKECNTPKDSITDYDKRRDAEIVKELKKFCKKCRKRQLFKRKDTKKGSGS